MSTLSYKLSQRPGQWRGVDWPWKPLEAWGAVCSWGNAVREESTEPAHWPWQPYTTGLRPENVSEKGLQSPIQKINSMESCSQCWVNAPKRDRKPDVKHRKPEVRDQKLCSPTMMASGCFHGRPDMRHNSTYKNIFL